MSPVRVKLEQQQQSPLLLNNFGSLIFQDFKKRICLYIQQDGPWPSSNHSLDIKDYLVSKVSCLATSITSEHFRTVKESFFNYWNKSIFFNFIFLWKYTHRKPHISIQLKEFPKTKLLL